MKVSATAGLALDELRAVFTALSPLAVPTIIDELVRSRRIALYGVGREGLMMRAFAMRLFHLGLDATVVGDMTTPPIGEGDLLLVSAGPGYFSTVDALLGVARQSGARTLVFTAQPDGRTPKQADLVVHIPAQTMADDRGGSASTLPMGSLYEMAQLLLFEIAVLGLRDALDRSPEEMRGRHTNLE